MPYDFESEAKRHWQMAEECRTMAQTMSDAGISATYFKLAKDYDQLAAHEVRVATNLKQTALKNPNE